MEILIKGEPKEIAALALELQERSKDEPSLLSDLEQRLASAEIYALKERGKWLGEFNASQSNPMECDSVVARQ